MQKKHLCLFAAFCLSTSAAGAAQAQDLTGEEALILAGKFAFFDKSLSSPPGQSCAACHDPGVGWTGPNEGINKAGAVYPGANHVKGRVFGNRKPPSAAYATISPLLDYDPEEEIFFGGNFWNGRATGWVLGNPAADQATGPFTNPLEQNDTEEGVCEAVLDSNYAYLFDIAAEEGLISGPIDCSTEDLVHRSYNSIALAIASYEGYRSTAFDYLKEVNQYASTFDGYWQACLDADGTEAACATGQLGNVEGHLTADEWAGFMLFVGKANCAACHPAPDFTDFTYDNLGVPKNPENPVYEVDPAFVDIGLGGFLAELAGDDSWRTLPFTPFEVRSLSSSALSTLAEENRGKQKVPTLRNVDKRPDPDFIKAYTHNGVFKSLYDVVHFYNTRDIFPECTEGGTFGVDCWPPAEVDENINEEGEFGDLGLTVEEELKLVTFMQTLTDSDKVKPPQAQKPKNK